MALAFGYDYVTDNYKVVAVLEPNISGDLVEKTEVKVNILSTNSWKNIQEFPFDSTPCDPAGLIGWLLNIGMKVHALLIAYALVMYGHDIWIMKEYGNNESWTKLFSVPYMRYRRKSYISTKAIYMFEDDRVLLKSEKQDVYPKLTVYDPRS
ncbi:uncharacterized protein LOC123904635 [Trifolium pratense]|uniref:uncharacterized protein LOC123904635 n=1 Tax=Trifolium pratense TaxID=57577 RepID=UPI001E6921AC|nr:uncharacterized protein LOC123904635 [Trifolium pratense]